jgi:hypothetical protein
MKISKQQFVDMYKHDRMVRAKADEDYNEIKRQSMFRIEKRLRQRKGN